MSTSEDRIEWNRMYDRRIAERTNMSDTEASGHGALADDAYNEGEDPVESADEELSCWD